MMKRIHKRRLILLANAIVIILLLIWLTDSQLKKVFHAEVVCLVGPKLATRNPSLKVSLFHRSFLRVRRTVLSFKLTVPTALQNPYNFTENHNLREKSAYP